MPYIDKEYYEDDFLGTPIRDAKGFDRMVKRASESIDIVTGFKIPQAGFNELPEFIQNQVKKATAAQVEYLALFGESAAMGSDGFGQVSAGNFSYGDRQGDSNLTREAKMVSGAVLGYLSGTGLLYTGVMSCD